MVASGWDFVGIPKKGGFSKNGDGDWGDPTIRNTPKLFLAHTGNLIPPSDRAYGTIIMKKKFQILEITKKTKFSSRKPQIWD